MAEAEVARQERLRNTGAGLEVEYLRAAAELESRRADALAADEAARALGEGRGAVPVAENSNHTIWSRQRRPP